MNAVVLVCAQSSRSTDKRIEVILRVENQFHEKTIVSVLFLAIKP